jgi:hypothetical protein
MTEFVRAKSARVRRLMAPAVVLATLALTAQAAFAVSDGQAKPQLKVEGERSPQGPKLTFTGKGFAPAARVKITATRAPGSSTPQDFGMFTADDKGNFQVRKVSGCTTSSVDDAREAVTFTAADSATGVKVVQKIEGAAWQCM